jgi:hypothetical protein
LAKIGRYLAKNWAIFGQNWAIFGQNWALFSRNVWSQWEGVRRKEKVLTTVVQKKDKETAKKQIIEVRDNRKDKSIGTMSVPRTPIP